jgi:hypothetical protein
VEIKAIVAPKIPGYAENEDLIFATLTAISLQSMLLAGFRRSLL